MDEIFEEANKKKKRGTALFWLGTVMFIIGFLMIDTTDDVILSCEVFDCPYLCVNAFFALHIAGISRI